MTDWAKDGSSGAAGPTYSEKPSWLKPDVENQNAAAKDWASAEMVTGVDAKPITAPRSVVDDDDEAKGGGKCKRYCLFCMSAMFLAFFIVATIKEKQQPGSQLQHVIFNGTSAGIPFLFLFHWMCCFPEKIIMFLSLGMAVWGIVVLILVEKDFKDIPKDSEERPDKIYEISIIAISIFSSLYHPCVMKCCINKKKD